MSTVKGKLIIGAEVNGVKHFDFEMRDPTIRSAANAIDKANAAGENLSSFITMRMYKAAEQLVSLGTLSAEKINAELLMGLDEDDIEPLLEAQDELEKKRKGLKS